MTALPTNVAATDVWTKFIHADHHNELHRLHNIIDGIQANLSALSTIQPDLTTLIGSSRLVDGLILDTAGAPGTVDGYRGMLVVKPPAADDEVVGLVIKLPDALGAAQDYAEGDFLIALSDADNFGAANPVNILKVISATTNATPVVVTTSTAHGFSTGDIVRITGTGIAALDSKWWKVTVTGASTLTLDTSTAPGTTSAIGYAFSDRSGVLGRWADTGIGTMSVHVAPALRGRSGAGLPTFGVWIQPSSDLVGLIIHNALATAWTPAVASDYISVIDVRAANAQRFAVNAAGQTVHDAGTVALPGITFAGDTDTGIYSTAGFVSTSINGAVAFTVGASQLFLADPMNIILGTGTGTKIGTAVGQKLGFYGTTPTAKLTGVAVTAAGIHAALVTLGLIAA